MTFDLLPKGRPKDVAATLNGDQLILPDGNAWTKFTGINDIYSDPNHPARYRVMHSTGWQGGTNIMTKHNTTS